MRSFFKRSTAASPRIEVYVKVPGRRPFIGVSERISGRIPQFLPTGHLHFGDVFDSLAHHFRLRSGHRDHFAVGDRPHHLVEATRRLQILPGSGGGDSGGGAPQPPNRPVFAAIAHVHGVMRPMRLCKVFRPDLTKMFPRETFWSDWIRKPDEHPLKPAPCGQPHP